MKITPRLFILMAVPAFVIGGLGVGSWRQLLRIENLERLTAAEELCGHGFSASRGLFPACAGDLSPPGLGLFTGAARLQA